MSMVNAMTLLAAWEQGRGQHSLQRTLTLLAAIDPGRSATEWATASIGERDAALFDFRERLFGARIEVTSSCTMCGAALQAEFSTTDIQRHDPSALMESFAVLVDDYDVRFRLPTSEDLIAARSMVASDMPMLLAERCIERAQLRGEPANVTALPAPVTAAVFQAMGHNDPLVDFEVGVTCVACGRECPMQFDIAEHLWGDIEEWVERLLHEVHLLASAYHWSERDILRLTATRRRLYLDMLGD